MNEKPTSLEKEVKARARRKLENEFAIQLMAAQVPKRWLVLREHAFAKEIGRRWRFDFAFPEAMLAVEVEGGTARVGRHTNVAGFREDCHKMNAAAVMGWRVLRGDQEMIRRGLLLEYVLDVLHERELPTLRGPKPYRRVEG